MRMKNRINRLEMAITPPGKTTIIVRYGDNDEEAERKIKAYLDAGGDERGLVVLNVIYDETPVLEEKA